MSCLWGIQNTHPQETQTHLAGTARRRAHRGAPKLPASPSGVRAAVQNRSRDDGRGPGSHVPTCSCPLSPGGVEGTSQGRSRPQEQHLALGGWQGGKHFIYILPSPSFGFSTCFFSREFSSSPVQVALSCQSGTGHLCPPLPKGGLVTSQTLSPGDANS